MHSCVHFCFLYLDNVQRANGVNIVRHKHKDLRFSGTDIITKEIINVPKFIGLY